MYLGAGTPHFTLSDCHFSAADSAVSSRLYQTPPLKPSIPASWRPRSEGGHTYAFCVWTTAYIYVPMRVCGLWCELVSRYARVCGFICAVALYISTSFCILFALLSCCCRIMSISHHASTSKALYFVAFTVQRGMCGSVGLFVRWHSTFQLPFAFCLLCLLASAAAALSCPFLTMPRPPKLSTLLHSLYNNRRTPRSCEILLPMRVLT